MKLALLCLFCTPIWVMAMTPDEGLERLMKGNARFVAGTTEGPRRDPARRLETQSSQAPFAVIVTCSDSRVVPDFIFDEGIGDLFVIRDAGNVVGGTERESVEYAVGHLNSVVVIVMGHQRCGAVTAVLDGQIKGIQAIAKLVEPAAIKAKQEHPKDPLTPAIKLNALQQKELLMHSPLLRKRVKEGKLVVRAAYYNLEQGSVELLD